MGMSEQEALTRSRALLEQSERSVEFVSTLILRDKPDATGDEIGGMFDAYGAASWNPQRAAGVNWSAWGRWEAWEHCKYEGGRVVATGDWVAWDTASGQQIGFSDKSRYSARRQAQMLAVYHNGAGAVTRVVSVLGFGASSLKFSEVQAEIESRIDADSRAALQHEARG